MENFQDLIASAPSLELLTMNVAMALVILVAGWVASIFAGRAVQTVALRSSIVDPTIVPVVRHITVWSIRTFVVIAVLARFGVQTASIITVLGAAGLAIGLALQGTLQNVSAGIMLLALRPVRVGETISVVGKADGTVEEIGVFLSRLKQGDGTHITLPNSVIWGNPIINYSRNPTRRLDFQVGVRYGDDLDLALSTLRELIDAHEYALKVPKPEVVVGAYRDSTVIVIIRVWAEASHYGNLNYDLHRTALDALKRAGLQLPIPLTEARTQSTPVQGA
jgi:small conductance mechanosensitive channel